LSSSSSWRPSTTPLYQSHPHFPGFPSSTPTSRTSPPVHKDDTVLRQRTRTRGEVFPLSCPPTCRRTDSRFSLWAARGPGSREILSYRVAFETVISTNVPVYTVCFSTTDSQCCKEMHHSAFSRVQVCDKLGQRKR